MRVTHYDDDLVQNDIHHCRLIPAEYPVVETALLYIRGLRLPLDLPSSSLFIMGSLAEYFMEANFPPCNQSLPSSPPPRPFRGPPSPGRLGPA